MTFGRCCEFSVYSLIEYFSSDYRNRGALSVVFCICQNIQRRFSREDTYAMQSGDGHLVSDVLCAECIFSCSGLEDPFYWDAAGVCTVNQIRAGT